MAQGKESVKQFLFVDVQDIANNQVILAAIGLHEIKVMPKKKNFIILAKKNIIYNISIH